MSRSRSDGVVTPLDEAQFRRALRVLSRRDPDLGGVVARFGPPPMWVRKPGFPTLVHIILEQQVSLASARAAFDRLREHIGAVTPARFLLLDDATLKTIGFSRQKTGYVRHLAEAMISRRFSLTALNRMSDEEAQAALLALKGIGRWTADIYLLMALRRPDIWPVGDLALIKAVRALKRLASDPSPEQLDRFGSRWRPWRAVAARILWHYYLSDPDRAKRA